MHANRFRLRPGEKLDLGRYDPADSRPFKDRQPAIARLDAGYRAARCAAGKALRPGSLGASPHLPGDGRCRQGQRRQARHERIESEGTQVFSFKQPSDEELDHDYLWRSVKALPERGRIGIFNRSYYEEVLVVRVHPEILEGQKLPPSLVTRDLWKERYEDINAFERHLSRNGTLIRKFFLHVSKDEQRRRFLERLDEPSKNWKFSAADLEKRDRWDDYMRAYEQAISRTSTKHAPWFIVPADRKWFTRLAIAELVVEALESLDLAFPKPSKEHLRELAEARKRLSRNLDPPGTVR